MPAHVIFPIHTLCFMVSTLYLVCICTYVFLMFNPYYPNSQTQCNGNLFCATQALIHEWMHVYSGRSCQKVLVCRRTWRRRSELLERDSLKYQMSFITFNESNKPSGFPFYEMKAQPTLKQSKALQVRENVCVRDLKMCPFKKTFLYGI